MSSTQISQEDQQVINYFTQNNFFVWNVKDKMPVAGTGNNGWSKIAYDDIKKYWDINSNSWGMRTGRQPNGKFIIGLDFDTWHKVGSSYINCNNTITLLSEFVKILGEKQDGFYISGTENNRGCLVDISNCSHLIGLLESIGKGRFQAENYHLEILNGHNFVIPPTATTCKISKVMRARKFMNDKYIYELIDCSPAYKFIEEYIRKCIPKSEISKDLYKKKADKEALATITEDLDRNFPVVKGFNKLLRQFLDCINPERAATYDNWFKLGLACQKNCITEEDKKEAEIVFKSWSSTLNGYDEITFDKHWRSWFNHNYEGLNFNYIMKCAKRDNPDKWFKCWIKYGIEMKQAQVSSLIDKYEKEVRVVLQPKLFLTKAYTFSGIEKWVPETNYNEIVHKYHLQFEEEFMWSYLKSQDKKIWYHLMDFKPTFKETPYREGLRVLNTFRGWDILNKKITVEPEQQTKINCDHDNFKITIEKAGAGSIFIEHILGMLGNDKSSWFFLQWISNLITEPDNRALCVPLLKGEHGCGKTSIVQLLGAIMDGKTFTGNETYYWQCDNPDQMLGNFNSSLFERILVNLNEPTFETLERYIEKNKRIITDDTLNIERKGQDVITVSNPIWEIITTNNDKIFNISSTERRYFIIDCKDNLPEQEKKIKFDKFYTALNDNPKALMDFFLICKQIRIPDFQQLQYETFIKNNKTQYHQQMIQSSISPLWGLIQEYIDEAEEEGQTAIFKRQTEIFKSLNAYCRTRGLTNPEDTNAIKTHLLAFDPNCYKRTRMPSIDGKEKRLDQFVLNIAALKDYMRRKNLIDTTISDE